MGRQENKKENVHTVSEKERERERYKFNIKHF